jgi:hypothetical protein
MTTKPVVYVLQEVVDNVSAAMLPYLQNISTKYTGVRFDYGHPADIVQKIQSYSNSEENRYKKYPLIGLFLDFKQTRGSNIQVDTSCSLNLFICVGTTNKLTPQQRTDQSFVPLIQPIYNEFLNQLAKHGNVITPELRRFRHDYVERYQWGKGGLEYYNNGQKNIFNDFIDAAEITGLEVDFKQTC